MGEVTELKFVATRKPVGEDLKRSPPLRAANHSLHLRIEPHRFVERPVVTVFCTGPMIKGFLWTPDEQVNAMSGAKGDMYTFSFSHPPLEPGKTIAITLYSESEIDVTGLTARSA